MDQIVKTTNSVFDERKAVGHRDMQRIYRRPPDLNLFSPAIFPQFFVDPLPKGMGRAEQRELAGAREALERQTGYGFEARTDAQKKALVGDFRKDSDSKISISPNMLMHMRSLELLLNTDLMAAISASELSACVRLPNEISDQIRRSAWQRRY